MDEHIRHTYYLSLQLSINFRAEKGPWVQYRPRYYFKQHVTIATPEGKWVQSSHQWKAIISPLFLGKRFCGVLMYGPSQTFEESVWI